MIGKQKQKTSGDTTTILTLLGRDTVIEGDLTFKETIRVDGRIVGKLISAEGTVIIGEQAVVDADIQVGVAIIRGTINGRVEASQRIEIHAPAKVNGDIIAPTVAIDSGVVFNGNCTMQSPPATATGKKASGLKFGGVKDQNSTADAPKEPPKSVDEKQKD